MPKEIFPFKVSLFHVFKFQYWDNKIQECLQCSHCSDAFEVKIPCSIFEDTICQDSTDHSILDNTFDQKVCL